MPYEVGPRFKRRFERKSREDQAAVLRCIAQLDENPRHPGLRTHRVQGHRGVWEARIDRGNRLTFEYRQGVIWLRNNCRHDETLGNP